MTRLNTPAGMPAPARISASVQAHPGVLIGGLEDDGVAVGQGRRDLPGGDGDREVPRRDQGDDADRLARDLDLDAGAHGGELLARHAQRFTREELEDVRRADGFADAFRERLAFLAREQPAELVLARQDVGSDLVEDVRAILDRADTTWRPRSVSHRRCLKPASAIAYSPMTSLRSDGLRFGAHDVPATHSPLM